MSGRHPSGLDLSRYADGELDVRRARGIAEHLEACIECRRYVEFIHELAGAARGLPADDVDEPALERDDDLAAEVLRRRRAGERVALKVPRTAAGDGRGHGGGPFTAAWRFGLGIAAALVLLALAGVYLFEAPPVAAGHSELDFGTELATPGSTLQIEYTPAVFLAGYDSLRLRVRSRGTDTPYPGHAGVIGDLREVALMRGSDGKFHGSLTVEPGELFLAASVEDFSGTDVDANLGRLWDVMVSGDSVPSTAALESRYRVLEAVNWVQATAWVKDLARRYPANPLSWAMLWRYEDRITPASPSDSLIAFHRAKLRELIGLQTEQGTTPTDLRILRAYARWLGEQTLADSLLVELARRDPDNTAVVATTLPDPKNGKAAWLERADSVWASSEKTDDNLVISALFVAGEANDSIAVQRWVDRGRQLPYLSPGTMAARLDPYDFTAGIRVRLREEWLQQLREAGEESRPLDQSVPEFDAWRRDQVRRTESALGRDLAVAGRTAASRVILSSVAESAWQPTVLGPYANFLLATGDTTTALDVVALLVADPVSGSVARTRFASLLKAHVDNADDFVRKGRIEYRRRVEQGVHFDLRLPANTRLHFVDGTTTTVGDRLAGSTTMMVLFEPEVPGLEDRIGELLERVSSVPAAEGLQVLLVSKRPSPGLTGGFGATNLLTDENLDLTQRLHAWGTEDLVLVNRQLDAIKLSTLDEALRIGIAISGD